MNISHQALSSFPKDFSAEEKILIQLLKRLLCYVYESLIFTSGKIIHTRATYNNIARSNEILGWDDVGNRQLFCFFKA
jgi:hypothetical protein